ncbi:MAG: hypothetical protein PVF70_12735 [Anaerolineales bacterium]|jgi:hypothetical protein
MKKRGVVGLFSLLSLVLAGCVSITILGETTPTAAGEFAIYLPATEQFVDAITDLELVALADEPVISTLDIVSYDAQSHEIVILPAAADRMDQLELPGKAFIVTVGGQPVYAGEFMAAYFSRSSDHVVILWPPMTGDRLTIQIQLGYPWADFFSGEDPRSDPLILESLRLAGVLN